MTLIEHDQERGVVLLSGAAKGIGRGLAIALAAEGWTIAACDVDEAGLAETIERACCDGACRGWVTDIADAAAVESWVAEAEEQLGPAVVLINNAINAAEGFFLSLTEQEWRRTIDVSLTGYFFCAQTVARRMAGRGYGRIVNMSSGSAERGIPRTVSYAAAKGGVNSLTRVMAVELASSGICVNTLTTGPMMTETFAAIAKTEEGIEARRRRVPIGRLGEMDDVLPLVRFLISPEARWTTGALFHVDGGANNAALVQSVAQ